LHKRNARAGKILCQRMDGNCGRYDYRIHNIFPENTNVKAQIYCEFLEETLPNLLEDVPLDILPNIIFQQDGHPAHTSAIARAILNHHFTNR